MQVPQKFAGDRLAEVRQPVKVTNLWVNRVVGDLQPAAARRFAFVGYPQLSKATPLRESGLLGPVRLEATAPRIAPQGGR